MTTTATITYYPGDVVSIGNGTAKYDVDPAAFQQLADPGKTSIWSHRSGKHTTTATNRLRLILRGREGQAADEAAQAKAEEIAADEAAKRKADKRPALNTAAPGRVTFAAPRPAFGQTAEPTDRETLDRTALLHGWIGTEHVSGARLYRRLVSPGKVTDHVYVWFSPSGRADQAMKHSGPDYRDAMARISESVVDYAGIHLTRGSIAHDPEVTAAIRTRMIPTEAQWFLVMTPLARWYVDPEKLIAAKSIDRDDYVFRIRMWDRAMNRVEGWIARMSADQGVTANERAEMNTDRAQLDLIAAELDDMRARF